MSSYAAGLEVLLVVAGLDNPGYGIAIAAFGSLGRIGLDAVVGILLASVVAFASCTATAVSFASTTVRLDQYQVTR